MIEAKIEIIEAPLQVDAVTLAAWDKKCLDHDAMTEEDWIAVLSSLATVFYASINGDLVGCAVAKWTGFGIGYLYSSAVLADYRGNGIGSQLVKARVQYLWTKNIARVQAHTRVDNLASGAMLYKCGFTAIQYVTDFYGDYEDGILWQSTGILKV